MSLYKYHLVYLLLSISLLHELESRNSPVKRSHEKMFVSSGCRKRERRRVVSGPLSTSHICRLLAAKCLFVAAATAMGAVVDAHVLRSVGRVITACLPSRKGQCRNLPSSTLARDDNTPSAPSLILDSQQHLQDASHAQVHGLLGARTRL